MPNVIKAYTVCYDQKMPKTIESHFSKTIETRRQTEVPGGDQEMDHTFIAGMDALMVKELSTQEEADRAQDVIEDAKKEAERILEEAEQEAQRIKEEAYVTANRKGYEEGRNQSESEAEKQKAAYEEKLKQLQKEYEDMAAGLEPEMVRIIVSLVEKITGIVVEDKKEVILYLVDRALRKYDKSEEYTLRVAKENYEYLAEQKALLLNAIGREVSLRITEDALLQKNQCMIETDTRVINCGLDMQLSNLITDLKILGKV